jgi:hypothetical protein
MTNVFTNAQCFDCGGSIVLINAATTGPDGWERYECQGCHRYLAIRWTGEAPKERFTHEITPVPPPAAE